MRPRRLLALLLLAGIAAAGVPGSIDKLAPLDLRHKGDHTSVPVALTRRMCLMVFVLGPPEVVAACSVTVKDAAGKTLDISSVPPLQEGDYTVEVEAHANLPIAPRLRITAFAPVDPYEPNDSWQQATPITPPLRTWILLEKRQVDWFSIDAPADGVLSIQFTRPLGGPYIYYTFTDGERKEIWRCKEDWDFQGARYFDVKRGARYYIRVEQGWPRSAWAEMELGLYRPQDLARSRTGQSGRILFLGDDSESLDLDQLKRILEAAALPLKSAVAEDVETMTTELVKDVQQPARPETETTPQKPELPGETKAGDKRGLSGLLRALIALALIGLGVTIFVIRRRA